MLEYFERNNLPLPLVIFDNMEEKHGTFIRDIPVVPFKEPYTKDPNLSILITSTKYGNQINSEILKKFDSSRVLNIQPFFKYNDLSKIVYETEFRKQCTELPQSEDIPEEFKLILKKLSDYQTHYINGENPDIISDGVFFIQENRDVDFFNNTYFQSSDFSRYGKSIKLQKLMNLQSLNKVTKLQGEHDYLLGLSIELATPEIRCEIAESISQFNQYLKEKNIPFLYYQLPNKLSSPQVDIPKNFINGENESATIVLEHLKTKDVDTLDFREFMIAEKTNSLASFYRTDIHWKQSLSLQATGYLLNKLESVLNIEFNSEFSKEDSYKKMVYPNMFLGCYGGQTGLLYGGIDDFELFLPKYKTDYSWILPKKGFSKRGDAENTFIYTPKLTWEMPGVITTYFVYGGSKYADYTILKNHLAISPLKILIICDSFMMPMSAFLAPHFSEIHFIDIRTAQSNLSKKDVYEIIRTVNPDLVLMTYWPHTILTLKQATDINPYKD